MDLGTDEERQPRRLMKLNYKRKLSFGTVKPLQQ